MGIGFNSGNGGFVLIDNYNRLERERKRPTVLGGNVLYLIVLTLMLSSSLFFGNTDIESMSPNVFYVRTFILQVAIIGVPPLLYLIYNKMDISQVIRLNRIKLKEAFLVIGMAIFGYGIVIFINYIWMWAISHIGPPIPQPTPPADSGGQYLAALLSIAIMPALVEEFLFRGVILRGYEAMGRKASVIMSGLLFALLHMNLASLPSIIFLGITISYIVQRSDSILSGIIYHFMNNTIAVTLVYISNTILSNMDDVQSAVPEGLGDMSIEVFLAGLMGFAIIMVFSVVLFMACLKAFKRSTEDRLAKSLMETERAVRIIRPVEMIPAIVAMMVIGALLVFEVFIMIAMV